jgi:hypothetical protein
MITIDWIDEHEIKTKKGHDKQNQSVDPANNGAMSFLRKLVEIARDIWHLNWLRG